MRLYTTLLYLMLAAMASLQAQELDFIKTDINHIDMNGDDWSCLTDELLKERPDRYSMDKVKAYLDRLPITEDGMPIEACGIRRREDAMMAAAAIIYSGSIHEPACPNEYPTKSHLHLYPCEDGTQWPNYQHVPGGT